MIMSSTDDSAIRKIIEDQCTAWDANDAAGFSRCIAGDASFTNIMGLFMIGHDGFLKQHEFVFNAFFKSTTLQQEIASLKFVRPDVAIVDTLASVSGMKQPPPGGMFDAAGRLQTRLLQVFALQNGEWKIVAYHNVAINHLALQQGRPQGQPVS
jgi:uncharacterized protein (TIGR02246 family)